MTGQTIPVEAIEAAARVLHAELNRPKFAIGSCLRCRQDAELMLAAAYPHLRQQWESERRMNPAFIAHGHGVAHTDCWCARCESEAKAQLVARGEMTQLEAFCDFMHLCRDCGDKRCPRASDHRAACAARGAAQPGETE